MACNSAGEGDFNLTDIDFDVRLRGLNLKAILLITLTLTTPAKQGELIGI